MSMTKQKSRRRENAIVIYKSDKQLQLTDSDAVFRTSRTKIGTQIKKTRKEKG